MNARPILVVELPVPPGREDEWNRWYHEVHIPDVLANVPGALQSVRYRLAAGDDDVAYLVIHEFESEEALRTYVDAPVLARRWDEYERLWGTRRAVRRRAFVPIFELGDRVEEGDTLTVWAAEEADRRPRI